MVCDVCKEADAVVQLTEIEGSGVRLLHLCERCAAERGVELALSAALMKAAGADSAPLRAGRLEGPAKARIRGRSEGIDVWLWQGHPL